MQPEEPLPPPDAKPTYHDMVVTVAQVSSLHPQMWLVMPVGSKGVGKTFYK